MVGETTALGSALVLVVEVGVLVVIVIIVVGVVPVVALVVVEGVVVDVVVGEVALDGLIPLEYSLLGWLELKPTRGLRETPTLDARAERDKEGAVEGESPDEDEGEKDVDADVNEDDGRKPDGGLVENDDDDDDDEDVGVEAEVGLDEAVDDGLVRLALLRRTACIGQRSSRTASKSQLTTTQHLTGKKTGRSSSSCSLCK